MVDRESGSKTYRFVVPEGTAERMARGEAQALFPRRFEARVGDTLEIVNQDDVSQTVGPYVVLPKETLRQTFTAPGQLIGECTLHPEGQVTIVVSQY